MLDAPFRLDLNEKFPRLACAPIVEAAIHWQARAQKALEQDTLRTVLSRRLPDYPKCEPVQQFGFMASIAGQETTEPIVRQQGGWDGFRLTSEHGLHVVQLKRDGIIFSRRQPYENWERFSAAALNAWEVFRDVAAPVEIQRLGVRFINHLAAATPETLNQFLREPPTCPSNLPLKEFVYQSTFDVPEHPFGVRVTKVMQPPDTRRSSGLFLDCDVYTTHPIDNDRDKIEDALVKMRWLKNKFFFTLLTPQAIQSFQ